MKRILLVIAVAALYALHQDIWFWRTAHPLVFGFVPIGLFYHGCFSVAASLLMWLLVKHAWTDHLPAAQAWTSRNAGAELGS